MGIAEFLISNFVSQKQETESFTKLVYALKEMNW